MMLMLHLCFVTLINRLVSLVVWASLQYNDSEHLH